MSSKPKIFFISALAFMLVACSPSSAEIVQTCPQSVKSETFFSQSNSHWQKSAEPKANHWLESISFSEGHPDHMYHLKPSSIYDFEDDIIVTISDFSDYEPPHNIWIRCIYDHDFEMVTKFDSDLNSCAIKYEKSSGFAPVMLCD